MVKNHFSIKVCRRLFVTYLVQARNLLTHFLLLESIAHASSRRQQQRTCTLVVALTFRSWPQVSFFVGARPQKMLMLESTKENLLKGSHSFFVSIFPFFHSYFPKLKLSGDINKRIIDEKEMLERPLKTNFPTLPC